jgi:hypothetical protein
MGRGFREPWRWPLMTSFRALSKPLASIQLIARHRESAAESMTAGLATT